MSAVGVTGRVARWRAMSMAALRATAATNAGSVPRPGSNRCADRHSRSIVSCSRSSPDPGVVVTTVGDGPDEWLKRRTSLAIARWSPAATRGRSGAGGARTAVAAAMRGLLDA